MILNVMSYVTCHFAHLNAALNECDISVQQISKQVIYLYKQLILNSVVKKSTLHFSLFILWNSLQPY